MWKTLSSTDIFRADPWLNLRQEKIELPDGSIIDDYFQLTLPDFTVVYAMTPESNVIVINQYKHGLRCTSLTLPGGLVEIGEEPLEAAKRELQEETGFGGGTWTHLGSFTVHGNLGCGNGHYYLARDVVFVSQPDSGDLETMQIELLPSEQLARSLEMGGIKLLHHATAISLANLVL